MQYPHKVSVKEIPYALIQTTILSEVGKDTSSKEIYSTPEEFLALWEPLVNYYERVKNANSIQS